jgi:hypothetical protein
MAPSLLAGWMPHPGYRCQCLRTVEGSSISCFPCVTSTRLTVPLYLDLLQITLNFAAAIVRVRPSLGSRVLLSDHLQTTPATVLRGRILHHEQGTQDADDAIRMPEDLMPSAISCGIESLDEVTSEAPIPDASCSITAKSIQNFLLDGCHRGRAPRLSSPRAIAAIRGRSSVGIHTSFPVAPSLPGLPEPRRRSLATGRRQLDADPGSSPSFPPLLEQSRIITRIQ